MGHGHCDDSSSTKAILGPGGTATDDPAILGRVAVQLLRDARNEASELRGIGIVSSLNFVFANSSFLTNGASVRLTDDHET